MLSLLTFLCSIPVSLVSRLRPGVGGLPRSVVTGIAAALVSMLCSVAPPAAAAPSLMVAPPPALTPPIAAVWPTDVPHPIVRAFEAPATRYSAGHRGMDIAATPGQTVYAIAAGTVSFAGTVVDRPVVSVAHTDALLSTVEPVTPTVTTGQVVAAGEQIGVVTTSAHCAPSCIHLGLRLRGAYISPLLLFGGIPRAVLLPLHPG